LVIETVVENINTKKDCFREIDPVCQSHTIFASNTSYQCIIEMARVTRRTDRFLGTHWFTPASVMRGVEVIKTSETSQETLDCVLSFLRRIGKEPAVCQDTPGFIVNRILAVWRNESVAILEENVAGFADIDRALKAAYDFRIGPFELWDLAGADVGVMGNETLFQALYNKKFRPGWPVVYRVKAGDLGRKTGRGFYEYK
ncbi:MAG: 3-hydroxyacyl-CoA dehydrogenase family protein, partial [Chloroflexota bacterium]